MVDCFTPQNIPLDSTAYDLHQHYVHHTEESYCHNSSALSLSINPKTFEQQLSELLEEYLYGSKSKDVELQGTNCNTNDPEANDPTYATSLSFPLPEETESGEDSASSISDPNREALYPAAHPLQSTCSTADINSEESPSIFDLLDDLVPTNFPLNDGPECGSPPNQSATSKSPITYHPPSSATEPNDLFPSNIASAAHPTPRKRNSNSRWEPYPLPRPYPQAPSTKDHQPSSTSGLRKIAPRPDQCEHSVIPNSNPSQDPVEALFDEFCRMPDDEELEDVNLDSLSDRSEVCNPNTPSVCVINDDPSSDALNLYDRQSCSGYTVQDSSLVTKLQPRDPSSEALKHHHHQEKKKEKKQRQRKHAAEQSRSRRTNPKELYICIEDDCMYSTADEKWKGFKTPDDMSRHILQHMPPKLKCPAKKCDKRFRRFDNLNV